MKFLSASSIYICALIALLAMPGRSAAQGFLFGEETASDTAAPVVEVVAPKAVVVETPALTTSESSSAGDGFFFGGEVIEAPASVPVKPLATDDTTTTAPVDTKTTPIPATDLATGQFQAATNYNIINTNGDIVCSVPAGHGLAPKALSSSKEYVKVQFGNAPNCGNTTEGWMAISGLQTSEMVIDAASSLTMRENPGSESKNICGLARGLPVTVIGHMPADDRYRAWVKVRPTNPPAGCSTSEGWVHGEYLRANDTALAGIPVDTTAFTEPDPSTEAGVTLECTSCMNRNVEALKEVVAGTMRLSKLPEWEQNRKLVQIPLLGSNGNIGPCGSHHYIPDDSYGTDAFAAPVTACALMSIMQEWKSRYPQNEGTRIQFGDISHKTLRKWNTHESHTDGNCFDVRPMRTGPFDSTRITHDSGVYSRALTKEFIELAKASGATTVLFNGQKVGASYHSNHDDHMHICIKDNDVSRKTCRDYKYDANICGAR